MNVKTITNDLIDENTYLIYHQDNLIIIDPGSNFSDMVSFIEEKNFTKITIYLTHGHYDHITSVNDLVSKYQCLVYSHQDELRLLKDPSLNLSTHYSKKIILDNVIGVTEDLQIDGFTLKVYLVPGHTGGHSMLYVKELNALFTGDFIFKGEIGRCDLPTGSFRVMKESLKILKTLDHQIRLYPGHGEHTSIKEELKTNPYLKNI